MNKSLIRNEMMQDERWLAHRQEGIGFRAENHRLPAWFVDEEEACIIAGNRIKNCRIPENRSQLERNYSSNCRYLERNIGVFCNLWAIVSHQKWRFIL